MSVRDERAAAIIRRHRSLADDFTRALPLLLDDLEAIDAAHAEPTGVLKFEGELTEEQVTVLRGKLADVVKPPAKPAPRRRART